MEHFRFAVHLYEIVDNRAKRARLDVQASPFFSWYRNIGIVKLRLVHYQNKMKPFFLLSTDKLLWSKTQSLLDLY